MSDNAWKCEQCDDTGRLKVALYGEHPSGERARSEGRIYMVTMGVVGHAWARCVCSAGLREQME